MLRIKVDRKSLRKHFCFVLRRNFTLGLLISFKFRSIPSFNILQFTLLDQTNGKNQNAAKEKRRLSLEAIANHERAALLCLEFSLRCLWISNSWSSFCYQSAVFSCWITVPCRESKHQNTGCKRLKPRGSSLLFEGDWRTSELNPEIFLT